MSLVHLLVGLEADITKRGSDENAGGKAIAPNGSVIVYEETDLSGKIREAAKEFTSQLRFFQGLEILDGCSTNS